MVIKSQKDSHFIIMNINYLMIIILINIQHKEM